MPNIWTDTYHQIPQQAIPSYVAIALGLAVGILLTHILVPRIAAFLGKQTQNTSLQKHNLPLLLSSVFFTTFGLYIYFRAIEIHVRYLFPESGLFVFTTGSITAIQCTRRYLMDSFPNYIPSINAATSFVSSLSGFILSLFATRLLASNCELAHNILIGATGVVSVTSFILLWYFDERLRRRSRFGGMG